MDFSSYFPIWNKLTPTQQQILERNAVLRKVDKGTVIHNGTVECIFAGFCDVVTLSSSCHAVHAQHNAGDVGRLVRSEECKGICDVLRLS